MTLQEHVREYIFKFLKHFSIGFVIVAVFTFFIGYFRIFSMHFTIKLTTKDFEIVATIIGFFSVLLGFILTALGIIVSGIQNRWHNENQKDKKQKINSYWLYIVKTTRILILFILCYILILICLSSLVDTIKQHGFSLYFIAWVILSTIQVSYITFDRIFDLYENPFDS